MGREGPAGATNDMAFDWPWYGFAMVVYWLICVGIVRVLCVTEVRREPVGRHEVQESGFRKIWLMRTWYGL